MPTIIPAPGDANDRPARSCGDLLLEVPGQDRIAKDIEAVTLKNGRPAIRSTCVECGAKKSRIGVLS